MNDNNKLNIGFWGTPKLAVTALDEMKKAGLTPSLIITSPDKPQGRKLVLTPPPVKVWAEENEVDLIQPEKVRDEVLTSKLKETKWDLFVVAAYGKIIPQEIIDIPEHGVLNIHPSLLPLYRGPSPVAGQILDGATQVGVSIMLIDKEVDHGPIIAQSALPMPEELPTTEVLEHELAQVGAKLLVETIPPWVAGNIEAQEQDHMSATMTAMLKKKTGS